MTNTINIISEVQQNFVDSSYDTNANRAFPNVRDGLKPGQRACLWEMYTKKYTSNKPHVKSAKIDGGVAALWWPHGTTALYETFARMSQPFTNNVPEVDFHGANGNIILGGDALAADRYTEARLAKITEEGMFSGINKKNVDMILNFSEDELWPKYLPSVFPRLLVNGAQGIGVSLANCWLPHNFQETADLILDYLDTGELAEDTYYPDFPTGGTIVNKDELAVINKTGKGRVIVEAKYKIVGREIIFYEMPYQVFIEPVIEKIKEKIESEELVGISGVFNKSDKKQISLVVECGVGKKPEQVLAQLFALTPLRSQYNANQNGIISKTPVLLNLKETIDVYIEHNVECIRREFEYDYWEALRRIEILKALIIANENIEEILGIIRTDENAKTTLEKRFELNDRQSQAILDMKLARLSNLENEKLKTECAEKEKFAEDCKTYIESESKRKKVLSARLADLAKKYGTPRKSELLQKEILKTASAKKAAKEKVIENVVIALTPEGYLKSIPVSQYRNSKTRYINTFKDTTDHLILLFSNKGKMYRESIEKIPTCNERDKGTACGSFLNLEPGEVILNVFPMEINELRPHITSFTKSGLIKKSEKIAYIGSTRNLNGMKVVNLAEDDTILTIQESNGDYAFLITNDKKCIKFALDQVNPVGKVAKGVKAINLAENDYVVEAHVVDKKKQEILLTSGKKYDIMNISEQNRGGKGKVFK